MSDVETQKLQTYQQLHETPVIFANIQELITVEPNISELSLVTKLRKSWPVELASLAVTLHKLRQSARDKFTHADRMWFDRTRMEQATSEIISRYKATRFAKFTDTVVYDLCCGIGGDAIALATTNSVIGVDLDPLALQMATWNADVYEVTPRFQTECVSADSIDAPGALIHIDPDRRSSPKSDRPTMRLEQYNPPLPTLQAMTSRFRGGALKLGPASNFGGKFPDAEVELISLHGECKEATIWFGQLKSDADWRATILPQGVSISGHPLSARPGFSDIQRYVHDPDPAVVRAGLVDVLAEQLNINRLDDAEEYLTSDEPVFSPFISSFEVIDIIDDHDKKLRAYFREHSCGELVIKARHIPIAAEQLRKKLKPHGDGTLVLIIARVAGKAKSILCRRVTTPI